MTKYIKNTLLILLITLFLPILLQAEEATNNTNWVKIPIMNKIGNSGHFQSFIMDRMIVSKGRSLSPARIVFYQIPLTDRDQELSTNEAIWNVISKGMELENITNSTQSEVTIMSGLWKATNRIIQVAISRDEKYLKYSIANYRESYHELLGDEIQHIQTQLTSNPSSSVKASFQQFFNFNLFADDTTSFDGSLKSRSDIHAEEYQVPQYVSDGLTSILTSENVSKVLSFAASAAGLSFLSNAAGSAVEALFNFFKGTDSAKEEREIIAKLLESKRSFEQATEQLRTIERGLDRLFEQAETNPDWLSGRTYPALLQDIGTLQVRLTEQANAKRQVLREEQVKQIRGQPVDCVDCLERLPVEIATLDNQIGQVNLVQERLRSETSICEMMKKDLDKIIEIESALFNLYNGIFATTPINNLREVIGSQARRQQEQAQKAQTNTTETTDECRTRIERVFNPILDDRLERNNLNWDIDDTVEACHLSWCLVGNQRNMEAENLSSRQRKRQGITCEREGMWDVFRGHTPPERLEKCKSLVTVMDGTRQTRVTEIMEQYNQEKRERLAVCDRITQSKQTPTSSIDTLILSEVNRNLEFLEQIVANQRDIRSRVESYQEKKRRLAEICSDI